MNNGWQQAPDGPVQNMWDIDIIAGNGIHDRKAGPGEFTGGDTETGLGGHSEGGPDGDTRYERIGF